MKSLKNARKARQAQLKQAARNAERAAERSRQAGFKAEQEARRFVGANWALGVEATEKQLAKLPPKVRELAAKYLRQHRINAKRQATLEAKRQQRQTLVDIQKQALIEEFERLGGVMDGHQLRVWLAGNEIRYEAEFQLRFRCDRLWTMDCEDENGRYQDLTILLPDPQLQAEHVLRAWNAKRNAA